ncbi:urate hydroxylase PuuD [Vibrio ulleungensis]|uniref:Urate hydroxylase PuuD n=1 Tax=Vibrio ulleungensis TaxID=2807619 RepID=A0ABS2HJK7_9VIBR|nr:urate hydroxylase PuuD [Vibrio ulleungensis]MBM7036042.1 urate hydroxylase PuuD [Vibrio ulleungensis]
MWPQLYEWIALFIKWFHVICAIAWIGASFYFTWLDNSLKTPPQWKQDRGIKGDLWAVHGGGFYEVAKYQAGPKEMPETLHWFKWEAYTTWLTGTALLVWMYYFNAAAYLVDPQVLDLSGPQAIGLGLGAILVGLMTYEIILRSPLSRTKISLMASLVIAGTLFFYLFCHAFSGRGAFIHMGALIGTIMASNVFISIIPGQRKMVAQVAAKQPIDPKPGLEGKRRSIHNNYFTLPIVFLMISNHYPMVYQHANNWLVGMAILLLSAWVRHYFNLKHSGQKQPWVAISGVTGLCALAIAVSYPTNHPHSNMATATKQSLPSTALTESQQVVMTIIDQRCVSCHSQSPSDDVFTIAPGGAKFDNWPEIERWAPRILARSVHTQDMPFLNKTQMTPQERLQLQQLLQ